MPLKETLQGRTPVPHILLSSNSPATFALCSPKVGAILLNVLSFRCSEVINRQVEGITGRTTSF